MSCYYKILGISRKANHAEIKQAYLSLVKKYHPDKNPQNEESSTNALKKINNAYAVLSNTDLRQKYDRQYAVSKFKKPDLGQHGNKLRRKPFYDGRIYPTLEPWKFNKNKSKEDQPGFAEAIFSALFSLDLSRRVSVDSKCTTANGMTTYTTTMKYENGKVAVEKLHIHTNGRVTLECFENGKLKCQEIIFPAYRF